MPKPYNDYLTQPISIQGGRQSQILVKDSLLLAAILFLVLGLILLGSKVPFLLVCCCFAVSAYGFAAYWRVQIPDVNIEPPSQPPQAIHEPSERDEVKPDTEANFFNAGQTVSRILAYLSEDYTVLARFKQVSKACDNAVASVVERPDPAHRLPIQSYADSTFAIDNRGRLWAWGGNQYGALGISIDGFQVQARLVSLPQEERVVQLYPFGSHEQTSIVALTRAGNVYAWGYDGGTARLGLGPRIISRNSPHRIDSLKQVVEVVVDSHTHACFALTKEGKLFSWGENKSGALGIGDTDNRYYPTAVLIPEHDPITSVAAIADGVVAITQSGTTYSWGNGSQGCLGLGDRENYSTPTVVPLPAGEIANKLFCFNACTFLRTEAGNVYTWGYNSHGELGVGDCEHKLAPTLVQLPTDVVIDSVHAGRGYCLFLTSNGQVYACGFSVGLGVVTTNQLVLTPTQIQFPADEAIVRLVVDDENSLALTRRRALYRWGCYSPYQRPRVCIPTPERVPLPEHEQVSQWRWVGSRLIVLTQTAQVFSFDAESPGSPELLEFPAREIPIQLLRSRSALLVRMATGRIWHKNCGQESGSADGLVVAEGAVTLRDVWANSYDTTLKQSTNLSNFSALWLRGSDLAKQATLSRFPPPAGPRRQADARAQASDDCYAHYFKF